MSITEAQRREGAHWLLHDPAAWPLPRVTQFVPEAWSGARPTDSGGRGASWFLPVADGEWVLRHYRRGGMARHLSNDRYWWAGIAKTRAWREWRLLARLHDLGLPVARPIAAHVQREGLFYRAALITERIVGARPLPTALAEAPLPIEQWQTLRALVARLAAMGTGHPDLNAANVLLRDDGAFFLIDFDRARAGALALPEALMLRRLDQSLRKFAARGGAFHYGAAEAGVLRA